MAVPRKKVSNMNRNNRRSHDALTSRILGKCDNCGDVKIPHSLCSTCQHYNKRKY